MPLHDRAKARLEHEITILRREVARLRAKQDQRRRDKLEKDVAQARLEQEVQVLHQELAAVRCDRDELSRKHAAYMRKCGGEDEQSRAVNAQLVKLDRHVTKQDKYIAFLEEQINHTRNKYHQRMTDVKQGTELVENELKKVRNEMRTVAQRAGEVDKMKKKISSLEGKLQRRNSLIAKYEIKHAELMVLVQGIHTEETKKEETPIEVIAASRLSGGSPDGRSNAGYLMCTYTSDMDLLDQQSEEYVPNPVEEQPSNFSYLATALKRRLGYPYSTQPDPSVFIAAEMGNPGVKVI